jgi:Tfp pilus assembly protein PilF
METLMRFFPVALSAAFAVAIVASAGQSQKPDDQIDQRSLALTEQAQDLTTAGKYSEAIDTLETALAVDPRNRTAYMGLAKVALAQKLPGKAIKLYGEALALEPNDINALSGQGAALVERGAVERAKQNLVRIKGLCKGNCTQATTLAAVIAKGPPPQVVTAARVPETVPEKSEN